MRTDGSWEPGLHLPPVRTRALLCPWGLASPLVYQGPWHAGVQARRDRGGPATARRQRGTKLRLQQRLLGKGRSSCRDPTELTACLPPMQSSQLPDSLFPHFLWGLGPRTQTGPLLGAAGCCPGTRLLRTGLGKHAWKGPLVPLPAGGRVEGRFPPESMSWHHLPSLLLRWGQPQAPGALGKGRAWGAGGSTLHSELDQAPVLPIRVDGVAAEEHRVPTVSGLELGGASKGRREETGRVF